MSNPNAVEQIRSIDMPARPRFDPWKRDKTLRQSAKRRAEGRWDGRGDPNGKAAAIAHNEKVRITMPQRIDSLEAKRRAHRNELARKRRAEKRKAA